MDDYIYICHRAYYVGLSWPGTKITCKSSLFARVITFKTVKDFERGSSSKDIFNSLFRCHPVSRVVKKKHFFLHYKNILRSSRSGCCYRHQSGNWLRNVTHAQLFFVYTRRSFQETIRHQIVVYTFVVYVGRRWTNPYILNICMQCKFPQKYYTFFTWIDELRRKWFTQFVGLFYVERKTVFREPNSIIATTDASRNWPTMSDGTAMVHSLWLFCYKAFLCFLLLQEERDESTFQRPQQYFFLSFITCFLNRK